MNFVRFNVSFRKISCDPLKVTMRCMIYSDMYEAKGGSSTGGYVGVQQSCMKQRKGVVQGDMWEYSEMYEAKEGSSTEGYVGVQ